MADEKTITQAVMEEANMVIMAVKKAEHLARLAQMMSRPGGPALK